MLPLASVIISVYNKFDFLKLVLSGFELQTEKNFEIIISDDGSDARFEQSLKHYIEDSSLNIKHNWHPDQGFRKNIILNSSVQKASSDYVIFVDGDCIPHPRFVEEHIHHRRIGVCLVGRRVDLSERITKILTPEKVLNGFLESPGMTFSMFSDYVKGDLKQFKNGIYLKNKFLGKWMNRKERGLLGANFSLFKSDLLAVNGFDERYTLPTFGEDSDVAFRLGLNGIQFKSVLNIAVLYHCYHKLLPRRPESLALFEKAKKENRPFTPFGINKET